jgi:hypothetical protein
VATLLISAQTRKLFILAALCSAASDVIATEMEEVVDLIVS